MNIFELQNGDLFHMVSVTEINNTSFILPNHLKNRVFCCISNDLDIVRYYVNNKFLTVKRCEYEIIVELI